LCQLYLIMEFINQSKIWKHFTRGDDNDSANCTHCSKTISCNGISTSGLFRHLKSKHKLSFESEEDQPCSFKKAKIPTSVEVERAFLLQDCLLQN